MREVCGVLITSTDTTACKNRILGTDVHDPAILCFSDNTCTMSVLYNNICHGRIFINRYIRKLFHLRKQLAGDLFSRHIFMKQDSRSGMCAFSCIGKFSVLLFKFYTVFHKIINNISGITDHNIHRFFPVLIMSGLHRVFEITVIVFFIS